MTAIKSDDHLLLERRYKGEHPLRTLLLLYEGDVRNLALSVFWYVIKSSGQWTMPLLTAAVIDVIASPQTHSLNELWLYLGIMAFTYIQNVPTHYLFIRCLSTATRNLERRLRFALAWRLQHLSMHFYLRSSTGALQTKLLRDVEVVQNLTNQLFQIFPAALTTLTFAVIVTAIRAPAFLLFYLFMIPITIFLVLRLRRPIQERNRDFREQVEGMSSRLIEMIRLIPVTRAHGIEQEELNHVDDRLAQVQRTGMRLDTINAVFGAAAWVVFGLFQVLCLAVAAYGAYTQILPISVGEIVMLTSFFTSVTGAILGITYAIPDITRGFESIYSIGEILEDTDLERNQGKAAVAQVHGDFSFQSVSFAYPDTDDSSLKAVSLDVHAGETIAIVGPSGAGKSTLVNLVIGFLRPSSGRILLDGIDMEALDLSTYRRFLSVVPQETILFNGTIRENILYGTHDISAARLQKAIDDANVREFVEPLAAGLDTLIGERGARLSGGQRQRIAIARALIRDPRVLILDEATSALDSASELLIQQALERLLQNRTTFVVAHRLSTVRSASRIVVLDAGRIIEIGTHDDLLNHAGLYADLYGLQHTFTRPA
ncbi:MAG TPA: ABC transporter ATP-binding protein [Phototrophicaceae bacterium]|nr:ABC transporter ATP-binding protein [Phototrophicaceae bacterium]